MAATPSPASPTIAIAPSEHGLGRKKTNSSLVGFIQKLLGVLRRPQDEREGLIWSFALQRAVGEQLLDFKLAVRYSDHGGIARHSFQHDPVIFDIVGPRVFAKEFFLFFQLGAVP